MPKCKNFVKLKFKKSKLIILLRAVLIFVVLSIFYAQFLLKAPTYHKVNKPNESSFLKSHIGRKILSIDFHNKQNCTEPAILDFPFDGFTKEQRQHGWIILHIVLMLYGFGFVAVICHDYLVPSIEQICSDFHIDRDVIGATVMAAAVSSPQLFMNCISTFVTKSDIGIGGIIGSAVFNILAVPSFCGLFITSCLKLERWPITRDCLIYLTAVLALVGILADGQIWWYEALGLILAYIGYMLIMYYNKKIYGTIKYFLTKHGYCKPRYNEVNEFTGLLCNRDGLKFSMALEASQILENNLNNSHIMLFFEQQQKEESIASPWSCQNKNFMKFLLRWPITFLLWLTVPNCRKQNSLKYYTTILSIVWIAGISYIVAFAITILGDTLNVPDAVMGLTILAAGMSIPEAVSSIIVTRQGQGVMGISNSLGCNTFDILLSLGLPWLIKASFLPELKDQKAFQFNSNSFTYAGIMLLTTLLALYLLLVWNKFTLNLHLGLSCLIMYFGFMVIATLLEFNIYFTINLPKCSY